MKLERKVRLCSAAAAVLIAAIALPVGLNALLGNLLGAWGRARRGG